MRRKASIIECDNPGCSEWAIDDEEVTGEPVLGYHFDGGTRQTKAVIGVVHYAGGGRPIPSFYACSVECIIPALDARMSEVG